MQRIAADVEQTIGQTDMHLHVLGQVAERRICQSTEQVGEDGAARDQGTAADIAAGFVRALEYAEAAVQRIQRVEAEAARVHAVAEIDRNGLIQRAIGRTVRRCGQGSDRRADASADLLGTESPAVGRDHFGGRRGAANTAGAAHQGCPVAGIGAEEELRQRRLEAKAQDCNRGTTRWRRLHGQIGRDVSDRVIEGIELLQIKSTGRHQIGREHLDALGQIVRIDRRGDDIVEGIFDDTGALRGQRREYRGRNRYVRLPVERTDADYHRRLIHRQRLEISRVSIGDITGRAVGPGIDREGDVLRGNRLAGDNFTLQRGTHAKRGFDRPARGNRAEADDLIRVRNRIAIFVYQLGLAADEEFQAGIQRWP